MLLVKIRQIFMRPENCQKIAARTTSRTTPRTGGAQVPTQNPAQEPVGPKRKNVEIPVFFACLKLDGPSETYKQKTKDLCFYCKSRYRGPHKVKKLTGSKSNRRKI